MASFLYGRSSHREMKVPSTPPQSSERRPQKALRRGLFWLLAASVSVVLVLVLVLFTPPGQRWAVHRAIEVAASMLESDSGKVEVELESVDLAWSPLGLSLNGLALHRKDSVGSRIPLASLSELVLLPADRSGMSWLTVSAQGLDVSVAGSQWLTRGTAASDESTRSSKVPFKVEHLDLNNVRIALPEALAPSRWNHVVLLENAAVRGLEWNGEWPHWTSTEGAIQLLSREGKTGIQDTAHIDWDAAEAPLHVRLSTDPQFWLASSSVSPAVIAACPGAWAATLTPQDSSIELSGAAEWGTVQLRGGLDSQSLRLEMVNLAYARLPIALPDAVPSSGELEFRGPVSLPFENGAMESLDWKNALGMASLTYRDTPAQGASSEASLEWDLKTGDIASSGALNAPQTGTDVPTELAWSTRGRFRSARRLST